MALGQGLLHPRQLLERLTAKEFAELRSVFPWAFQKLNGGDKTLQEMLGVEQSEGDMLAALGPLVKDHGHTRKAINLPGAG